MDDHIWFVIFSAIVILMMLFTLSRSALLAIVSFRRDNPEHLALLEKNPQLPNAKLVVTEIELKEKYSSVELLLGKPYLEEARYFRWECRNWLLAERIGTAVVLIYGLIAAFLPVPAVREPMSIMMLPAALVSFVGGFVLMRILGGSYSGGKVHWFRYNDLSDFHEEDKEAAAKLMKLEKYQKNKDRDLSK